jgi:hypothetical protein
MIRSAFAFHLDMVAHNAILDRPPTRLADDYSDNLIN